jgi:pimeloyl-ACP methyl ester carboxylesterase
MKSIVLILFILAGDLVLRAQESGYANIGNAKIYYEQKGEGTPIIFLHFGYCDTQTWNWVNKVTWQPGPIWDLSADSKMDVPTLICLGELSLPFYHRSINEINQTLPNSKLIEISHSGHMIQLENPKEFNIALRQFLKSRVLNSYQ